MDWREPHYQRKATNIFDRSFPTDSNSEYGTSSGRVDEVVTISACRIIKICRAQEPRLKENAARIKNLSSNVSR